MHAAEEKIYAEIGDQDAQEGQDTVEMEKLGAAEALDGGRMERRHVDEHGDEGPDLLGVPTPIAAP